jgi:L-threonylcarbamoyladenylate synthase
MKTEVLGYDELTKNIDLIKKAADLILAGENVVFPTETVYGLGASAYNPSAVRNIYKIKGRPQDNPLIVHVSSFEQLNEVAFVSHEEILRKLMPGPITFIFKKKDVIPPEVSAGLSTVGIRMPAHPFALKLIEYSEPIAAPSANLSGYPSPTRLQHVLDDLDGKVPMIIDGGECPFGIESTIIDISRETPVLLRPGPIVVEELVKIFGNIIVPDKIKKAQSYDVPIAPGMKYRHYSPKKPLYMFNPDNCAEMVRKYPDALYLCAEERKDNYPNALVMGKLSEPYSIAKNLFESLREIDKSRFNLACVEHFPETGILFSVMNRLKKASSRIIS